MLATAERLVNKPEVGYLGAVVISPAADLRRIVTRTVDQPGLGVFMALAAVGAKWSEPRLRLERLLTAEALDRLVVADTGCLGVATAVHRDLSGPDLVELRYLTEPHFGRFLDANTTGRRAVAGPVLPCRVKPTLWSPLNSPTRSPPGSAAKEYRSTTGPTPTSNTTPTRV